MKLPILLAATFLTLLASSAEARCRHTPATWRLGYEIITETLVTDGSTCVIPRPYINGKTRIFRTELVSRPSHGSVTISHRTTITYRPTKGFKGEDQYIYKYFGVDGLTPGTVTIRVDVTVH